MAREQGMGAKHEISCTKHSNTNKSRFVVYLRIECTEINITSKMGFLVRYPVIAKGTDHLDVLILENL